MFTTAVSSVKRTFLVAGPLSVLAWGGHHGGPSVPEDPCTAEEAAAPWRTISGHCNNLRHQSWGEHKEPFAGERNYADGLTEPNIANLPLERSIDLEMLAPGGNVDPYCDDTLVDCDMYADILDIPNINKGVRDENVFSTTLSSFVQPFGQFLTHDLFATEDEGICFLGIGGMRDVPEGYRTFMPPYDPFFWFPDSSLARGPPGTLKGVVPWMSFFPSLFEIGEDGVRRSLNFATAYLDLNPVYGSDYETAALLREDFSTGTGRMKTRDHFIENLGDQLSLPFLHPDVAGNHTLVDFPPTLADIGRNVTNCQAQMGDVPEHTFACGDLRCGENSLLLVLHVLYLREHNRIAGILKENNPDWDGETLYQEARRINIGQYQKDVRDFFKVFTGDDDRYDYQGYDDDVDATTELVFSFAMRQHTIVIDELPIIDRCDNPTGGFSPPPHIPFSRTKNAYLFAGQVIAGMDEIHLIPWGVEMGNVVRGMLATPLGEPRDFVVTNSLRVHLGNANLTGLSIPSLNLRRARDDGVPFYNDVRKEMIGRRLQQERGCHCEEWDWDEWRCSKHKLRCFEHISSDPVVAQKLQDLYGSVDLVDMWVGINTEDRLDDGTLGRVGREIFIRNFASVMNGDRFWFENEDYHDRLEIEQFRAHNLRDLYINNMPDDPDLEVRLPNNVFYMAPDFQEVYECD